MKSSHGQEHPGCLCNGIRFCALCRHTERVEKVFAGEVSLQDAATVIANQQKEDRTSSVSFALIGPSNFSLCRLCGCVFEVPLVRNCGDHADLRPRDVALRGVFVTEEFLSVEEEDQLVSFFDSPTEPFAPWKDSLSGRRKHEFGPKKNFKKKKVKPADLAAMPRVMEPVLSRVSEETQKLTGAPYKIAEASVLEYMQEKISNIDPHIDDTWLWGGRIGGINLLEDCAMTFVNKNGIAVEVHLPRRCFFLMTGDSRYTWMHGIRPESVTRRRISVTLRELSDEIAADIAVAQPVWDAATNYL